MENSDSKNSAINKEVDSLKGSTSGKKEFFVFTYIKEYAQRKPRETFTIMLALVVLSVIFSISNYLYVERVSKPKYEELKKKNFLNGASNALTTSLWQTEQVLDIRGDMKELEFYKTKEHLTRQDSIRVRYLIDKYKK